MVIDSSAPARHRRASVTADIEQRYFGHSDALAAHGKVDDRHRGITSTVFDDRRRHGPSWPAGWAPPNHDKAWRYASTSLDWSSLSKLFHFFEAPRRRTLISSSAGAPSMMRFCMLCSLWYMSSAMSSNTGKAILTQFKYPITLTIVQFGFVAAFCLLFASPAVRLTRLRRPTRAILKDTFPMGLFQVGGHMFSSMAISRIPVSTVHTIKALSPLFTVAAYALMFGVKYSPKTYISLLPLTLGVMLACSFDMSVSNALGLICAFGSAMVFVSSNIFFKKIMPSQHSGGGPSQAPAHKLDKLNLLFYSSGMAFLLMIPIWIIYDLPALMASTPDTSQPTGHHDTTSSVLFYFILNGTVHFGQNIIAFVILASTSPVTYSIASLFKRVAVICIAIIWFNQVVHLVQAFGICLTFVGLWMYNNSKADVEKGERKARRVEAARELMLPSTNTELRFMTASPAISDSEKEVIFDSQMEKPASFQRPDPVSRPHARSQSISPPYAPPHNTHSFNQAHQKNLHIQTNHANLFTKTHRSHLSSDSPMESYPSPPPSHDSPPPSATILASPPFTNSNTGKTTGTRMNRRNTITSRDATVVPVANTVFVTA